MSNAKKIVLLSVILVAACGATGPKFFQREAGHAEKATIYIYRPWAALDGAASPTVQVNRVDSFDLGNAGYQVLPVEPSVPKLLLKMGGFMSNWRAGDMAIEYPFEAKQTIFNDC